MLTKRMGSPVFSTLTAEEYMWNWTDPVIDVARKFAPTMVPLENMGILHNVSTNHAQVKLVQWSSKWGAADGQFLYMGNIEFIFLFCTYHKIKNIDIFA